MDYPYSGRYSFSLDAEHIGEGGNGVSIRAEVSELNTPIVASTDLFQTGIEKTVELNLRQGQRIDIEVRGRRDVAFDTVGLMAIPTLIEAD